MKPTIGVIGGIGAKATFDFCQILLALAPAKANSDYPRILVDCNPQFPDINTALLGAGPSPADALAASAIQLECAGANCLVLICNGAHAYADDIRQAVNIPFVSMIDAAVDRAVCDAPTGSQVGVLATNGVLKSRVFAQALEAAGHTQLALEGSRLDDFMCALDPEAQRDNPERARAAMKACADLLVQRGAKVLIIGCTEAKLMLESARPSAVLIDPLDALAQGIARLLLQVGNNEGECSLERFIP